MLVVKIELHSAITGGVTEIGRMLIGNDGESDASDRGDYDVHVLRRGAGEGRDAFRQWRTLSPVRTGRVEGYPRSSYSVWRLVARALLSAFPEERR